MGDAIYREAELHRLHGRFEEALERYRQASELGRSAQPGLALLRLAQGQTEAAAAALRRELSEQHDVAERTRFLPAFVEAALAAGAVADARGAAEELSTAADALKAPYLTAAAASATGAVLLAEGDAQAALAASRAGLAAWQELEAPHDAARARVLIGLACRALGDEDTCDMELEAARRTFEQLGAAPDLVRVAALRPVAGASPGRTVLTPRELEVLRLVASGRTNRAIAGELVISEKTVARHVSNIFAKIGLSSRAAATAFAYEHDLV
jgi:DNA-binding NarL/FixJ family response regulator